MMGRAGECTSQMAEVRLLVSLEVKGSAGFADLHFRCQLLRISLHTRFLQVNVFTARFRLWLFTYSLEQARCFYMTHFSSSFSFGETTLATYAYCFLRV